MIIKRYVVDNMNEAMVRIRYELGNDAVIVSQRKIRQKGIIGILKPRKLEVTAAADEKQKNVKSKSEKNEELEKELSDIKNMVSILLRERDTNRKDNKNKTKQKLLENDIPNEIIEDIYNNIKLKNQDKKLTPKMIESCFKEALMDIIKIDENKDDKIQVLVGPTGVGKTTTIAKLASLYSLYQNKKVGLITIDTYRIGAVEQLKTYAEILSIPFEVALSLKDIPEIINKMKGCDVILIDTTGRNSKNIMQISETRKYVETINAGKVHLVLSMTTKQSDLKKIIENYKIVNYNSLILTKVDETNAYGSILSCCYYGNVPISFLTTGQNVPEDIERADKDKILKLVLGVDN
ncbi:flagellar biosynthesis protein FlhF [Caloramator quimbayensis]|uniref:Flagellar biosynthesis protein FlhF n=1 Tax=Caloramator quimbayensis TaxID=1147123 RepID=A0A1T4XA56_9CLOT|nr:flagellar biosynthesis protein FlhF [Caloramator quimbayensis]SKA86474.1 flagellar biosynthesis protein FlhF [Caloramator quimbayensis]